METKIFDGRAFAAKKEGKVKGEASKLRQKGITPKLVSILVGDDPASMLYVNLKKKAGERVGVHVVIVSIKASISSTELIQRIKKLNADSSVSGIMIQLPLPTGFSEKVRDEIISSISKEKDVDGLRENSHFLTPTVKSVLFALKEASENIVRPTSKVLIVGHTGFEGGKIFKVLTEMGYKVEGVDSKTKDLKVKTLEADVLISATGSPEIIRGDMIKEGAAVIDIGAPKGDVVKDEVLGKASFLSPVPGGIGPVTIVSLLENLIESGNV